MQNNNMWTIEVDYLGEAAPGGKTVYCFDQTRLVQTDVSGPNADNRAMTVM